MSGATLMVMIPTPPTSDADPRHARIWATRAALAAHGIEAEVAESEPVLAITGEGMPTIRCAPRASDGGTLWLFQDDGPWGPIAPADAEHLHEVIVWVKGRLADAGLDALIPSSGIVILPPGASLSGPDAP